MIEQMAIDIVLPGFSNLGRSVTPIFLWIEYFLQLLSMISQKMKKIYPLQFFAKCTPNSVIFGSTFICAAVSNASCRVKLCGNVGNIRIIYATAFLQNMTKNICLC